MFAPISRFYDLVLRDAHAEPEEIVDVTRRALQERITAAVQEVEERQAEAEREVEGSVEQDGEDEELKLGSRGIEMCVEEGAEAEDGDAMSVASSSSISSTSGMSEISSSSSSCAATSSKVTMQTVDRLVAQHAVCRACANWLECNIVAAPSRLRKKYAEQMRAQLGAVHCSSPSVLSSLSPRGVLGLASRPSGRTSSLPLRPSSSLASPTTPSPFSSTSFNASSFPSKRSYAFRDPTTSPSSSASAASSPSYSSAASPSYSSASAASSSSSELACSTFSSSASLSSRPSMRSRNLARTPLTRSMPAIPVSASETTMSTKEVKVREYKMQLLLRLEMLSTIALAVEDPAPSKKRKPLVALMGQLFFLVDAENKATFASYFADVVCPRYAHSLPLTLCHICKASEIDIPPAVRSAIADLGYCSRPGSAVSTPTRSPRRAGSEPDLHPTASPSTAVASTPSAARSASESESPRTNRSTGSCPSTMVVSSSSRRVSIDLAHLPNRGFNSRLRPELFFRKVNVPRARKRKRTSSDVRM